MRHVPIVLPPGPTAGEPAAAVAETATRAARVSSDPWMGGAATSATIAIATTAAILRATA